MTDEIMNRILDMLETYAAPVIVMSIIYNIIVFILCLVLFVVTLRILIKEFKKMKDDRGDHS